ncbi:hypothetical protein K504DRAFT_487425 [Pleomassaria siparia CBS 279.74]|uniref:C-type lectin domain-containing protein n=1 Tax=Pleomassaria siparia CBS 279.74 TaxID=1314801 RepID=A0A6G1KJ38_9PLEO|nr:hypothetical protein K504DRAFT_487425 [Pleomassaria siparia CBS 279.74]
MKLVTLVVVALVALVACVICDPIPPVDTPGVASANNRQVSAFDDSAWGTCIASSGIEKDTVRTIYTRPTVNCTNAGVCTPINQRPAPVTDFNFTDPSEPRPTNWEMEESSDIPFSSDLSVQTKVTRPFAQADAVLRIRLMTRPAQVGLTIGRELHGKVHSLLERVCPPYDGKCNTGTFTFNIQALDNAWGSFGGIRQRKFEIQIAGGETYWGRSHALRMAMITTISSIVENDSTNPKNCRSEMHWFRWYTFCNVSRQIEVWVPGGEDNDNKDSRMRIYLRSPEAAAVGGYDCVGSLTPVHRILDAQLCVYERWLWKNLDREIRCYTPPLAASGEGDFAQSEVPSPAQLAENGAVECGPRSE